MVLSSLFGNIEFFSENQKLQKDLKECQTELETANEQLNSDYRERVGYSKMLKDSVELLKLEAEFKALKSQK